MSSYLVSYFRIRVVMWLVILKDQSGYVVSYLKGSEWLCTYGYFKGSDWLCGELF